MDNENYPQPDPNWEYCEIWNALLQARDRINNVLDLIKEQEHASVEVDSTVVKSILEIVKSLEEVDGVNREYW